MALIRQHDKRSGITYVYESRSWWDPERKMSRSKRTLVGRLDPETGEVVPTDGRMRRAAKNREEAAKADVGTRTVEERLAELERRVAELEAALADRGRKR
jgi:hypothetical protein